MSVFEDTVLNPHSFEFERDLSPTPVILQIRKLRPREITCLDDRHMISGQKWDDGVVAIFR